MSRRVTSSNYRIVDIRPPRLGESYIDIHGGILDFVTTAYSDDGRGSSKPYADQIIIEPVEEPEIKEFSAVLETPQPPPVVINVSTVLTDEQRDEIEKLFKLARQPAVLPTPSEREVELERVLDKLVKNFRSHIRVFPERPIQECPVCPNVLSEAEVLLNDNNQKEEA